MDHPVITSRPYNEITEYLALASNRGVRGELKRFDEGDMLTGNKSLLSLGEGLSNFIKIILESSGEQADAHALDILYDDINRNIVESNLTLSPSFSITQLRAFMLDHSQRYHFGYAQDFEINRPDGQRVVFDEIISSYALTFILRTQPEALVYLLENHLRKGGFLRIIFFEKSTWLQVWPILERLLLEGKISNYTDLDNIDSTFNLTIQK